MNTFVFLWNSIFYHPVVNLILFIYKYGGGNLGVAIILITIIIRLLLWPFMKSQIRAMQKMQALKPQMDVLKDKYKGDKRKLQEAQLQLYRESGTNPAGSFIPLLVQLPFIIAVYNVIRIASSSSNAAVFNSVVYTHILQLSSHQHFNTSFLGINLAKNAAIIGIHNFPTVVPYLILTIFVGITQFFASKLTMPTNINEVSEAVEVVEALEEPKKRKGNNNKVVAKNIPVQAAKKEESTTIDPEELSRTLSTQMLYILPVLLMFMSLGFSGNLPAALSVYWVIQSLVLIIQTLILQDKLPWKQKN